MKVSDAGIKALCSFEGFRTNAYQDSAKIWTIGYGSIKVKGVPVKQGDTITVEEAMEQKLEDLKWVEKAIERHVKVPLEQHQYDALVCLIYNIGEPNFRTSTLLRKLNAGKYLEAAEEFLKWNRAGGRFIQGLMNRRQKERLMFLGK